MLATQPNFSAIERFVSALRSLERHRDVEPLLRCFAPQVELSRLGRQMERGIDGARHFWEEYREGFGQLESHFVRFNDGDPVKVLEWRVEGTLPSGAPVYCAGISLLEVDGDQIIRFRTYFDSSAIVRSAAADAIPPAAGPTAYSKAV